MPTGIPASGRRRRSRRAAARPCLARDRLFLDLYKQTGSYARVREYWNRLPAAARLSISPGRFSQRLPERRGERTKSLVVIASAINRAEREQTKGRRGSYHLDRLILEMHEAYGEETYQDLDAIQRRLDRMSAEDKAAIAPPRYWDAILARRLGRSPGAERERKRRLSAAIDRAIGERVMERWPRAGGPPPAPPRPAWDKRTGELEFMGHRARKVDVRRARHVVKILDSFQELEWPEEMDDPLPGDKDPDRLREAVRCLNHGLKHVHFGARLASKSWWARWLGGKIWWIPLPHARS